MVEQAHSRGGQREWIKGTRANVFYTDMSQATYYASCYRSYDGDEWAGVSAAGGDDYVSATWSSDRHLEGMDTNRKTSHLPRLTKHQLDVLVLLAARAARRESVEVSEKEIGSLGAVSHLAQKGYIAKTREEYGPLGGIRCFWRPTEAGWIAAGWMDSEGRPVR